MKINQIETENKKKTMINIFFQLSLLFSVP